MPTSRRAAAAQAQVFTGDKFVTILESTKLSSDVYAASEYEHVFLIDADLATGSYVTVTLPSPVEELNPQILTVENIASTKYIVFGDQNVYPGEKLVFLRTLTDLMYLGGAAAERIFTYTETLDSDDLVDGGSDTGTLALGHSIPAGAMFLGAALTAVTGFAGDVSAAATLGDGTDVDRYNTSTVNVFATAATGIDMGVPSGARFHATAKTPTLTVVSDADISAVISNGAGACTVKIVYLLPS